MIGQTNRQTDRQTNRDYNFIYLDIYIIKQDSHKYICYIAGQTAGPIGLKFFVDIYGWPGVVIS